MNFRTAPFAHQREAFERTRDLDAYAFFWEMGTGKSWIVVNTAAWLFLAKKIDGLVVVSPSSVVRNWTLLEIPKHLPAEVPWRGHAWSSRRARTKTHQREFDQTLTFRGGLAVLSMSYDALRTDAGADALWAFLSKRRALYCLDEATRIKSPGAATTKRVLASAAYAPFRRILTGTPIANTPFDAYAPVRFLRRDFWHSIHCRTFAAFRNTFGVMEPIEVAGRTIMRPVAYKNFELLGLKLSAISHRVLKANVLDLPPKVYVRREFELPPEHRAHYDEIEQVVLRETEDGALESVTALERILRLQQATCGYKSTGEGKVELLPGEHRRMSILRETIEEALESAPQRGVIVWAWGRADVQAICDMLQADGVTHARIDGTTKDTDRPVEVSRFQAGDARVFVGNPAAAGEGITLTRATTVIYYSRSYSLQHRLQSEDRAHRAGQTESVTYVDIVAEGTIDLDVLNALQRKDDIARTITGDGLRDWIVARRRNQSLAHPSLQDEVGLSEAADEEQEQESE